MGPRAGLDGRKISPHRDSIPRPSIQQSVAIPTELPGPQRAILEGVLNQERRSHTYVYRGYIQVSTAK